jgi:hypothetical protein
MALDIGKLCSVLTFDFKSFTSSSKHESKCVSAMIDALWREGRLTKDTSWERNFDGAFLVRKLTAGLIRDALEEGTLNCDVTLTKALSILLVAPPGARSRDVTVAPLDSQELSYLCSKDITLKLVVGNLLENLVAKVVIRNEKGQK